MKHDFRELMQVVKDTVKDMDRKDPNWKWKVQVQKAQIKVFWEYLEYRGNTPPFIITDGVESNGCGECECSEQDPFIVLRDERGYYMSGRIVENTSYGDGTFEECVVSLLRYLQRRVNHTY